MGIDFNLFRLNDSNLTMTFIRENCLCPICGDILDDAVELKSCQHYFCYSCIVLWDKTQQTANKVCPECRTAYKFADRQRPPRIFNKILCDWPRQPVYRNRVGTGFSILSFKFRQETGSGFFKDQISDRKQGQGF
ncbi:unnamed protein product [Oikopleura dioica]|uniref:RING-type domain-containing protein n=1 Tax=Oikopleura dioica TaxID=34765 RepID=E4WQ22_OIKDI|nr:unnamed protein product [Oikopleura dioica]